MKRKKSPKTRNPVMESARFRSSGAHVKSRKAQRRAKKVKDRQNGFQ